MGDLQGVHLNRVCWLRRTGMWGESENQHAAGDAEPGCRAEGVGKVRIRQRGWLQGLGAR